MANGVRQILGPVSAYALAVKHGYTGTEQEWAQTQAQAGTHARAAQEAAQTASGAAEQASGSASAAETSKQAAAAQAREASARASAAASSASSAQESASSAATSAETATEKASAATTSAESAAESAEKAEVAAQEAAASAEAAQNIIDDEATSTTRTWSSQKIHEENRNTWKDAVDSLATPFEQTDALVQCHPVAGYPLQVLSHIKPVQEGSGDPSPDNVRPMKGFTEAKLTRCGVNLESFPLGKYTHFLKMSGLNFPAGKYTFDFRIEKESNSNHCLLNIGDLYLRITPGVDYKQTWDIKKPITAMTLYTDVDWSSSQNVSATLVRAGIYRGTKATGEPYQGNEYTVQFGKTVYGGTYDWGNGELSPWVVAEVPLSKFVKENGFAQARDVGGPKPESLGNTDSAKLTQKCSIAKIGNPYSESGDYLAWAFFIDGYCKKTSFRITQKLYDRLKADSSPLVIMYKSKEAPSVHLPPQKILALSGTNNLYSDTGDTTVQGRNDPVHEMQQLRDAIAALGAVSV